jgi:hypothetical protein
MIPDLLTSATKVLLLPRQCIYGFPGISLNYRYTADGLACALLTVAGGKASVHQSTPASPLHPPVSQLAAVSKVIKSRESSNSDTVRIRFSKRPLHYLQDLYLERGL